MFVTPYNIQITELASTMLERYPFSNLLGDAAVSEARFAAVLPVLMI
jgi:hypothetical protein